MKVWMLWHGGSSYAAPAAEDAEEFDSLRECRDSFERRTWSSETFYPCVSEEAPEDGGPEGWLFFSDPRELGGDLYPDRLINYGPRGGLLVTEA